MEREREHFSILSYSSIAYTTNIYIYKYNAELCTKSKHAHRNGLIQISRENGNNVDVSIRMQIFTCFISSISFRYYKLIFISASTLFVKCMPGIIFYAERTHTHRERIRKHTSKREISILTLNSVSKMEHSSYTKYLSMDRKMKRDEK